MVTICVVGMAVTGDFAAIVEIEDALEELGWCWDDETGWWPNQIAS